MISERLKNKIYDYAQVLYIKVDSNGNNLYSCKEISDLIFKRFKKRFHENTVWSWGKKRGWNILRAKALDEGIKKAKEIEKNNNNQIIENQVNDVVAIYEFEKQIYRITSEQVVQKLKGEETENEELMKDIDYVRRGAKETILNLNKQSIIPQIDMSEYTDDKLKEIIKQSNNKELKPS